MVAYIPNNGHNNLASFLSLLEWVNTFSAGRKQPLHNNSVCKNEIVLLVPYDFLHVFCSGFRDSGREST